MSILSPLLTLLPRSKKLQSSLDTQDEILQALTHNQGTMKTDLIEQISALNANLSEAIAVLPKGIVKSIQTGKVDIKKIASVPPPIDISISSIDPDKCLVIINYGIPSPDTTPYDVNNMPPSYTLNNTTLSIAVTYKVGTADCRYVCQWQIIEYY